MWERNISTRVGVKAAEARLRMRVRGRIQKQHLFHHHLRDGVERGKAHGGELRGLRGALGGKIAQHTDDVFVTSDHPNTEQRVPMDG